MSMVNAVGRIIFFEETFPMFSLSVLYSVGILHPERMSVKISAQLSWASLVLRFELSTVHRIGKLPYEGLTLVCWNFLYR